MSQLRLLAHLTPGHVDCATAVQCLSEVARVHANLYPHVLLVLLTTRCIDRYQMFFVLFSI